MDASSTWGHTARVRQAHPAAPVGEGQLFADGASRACADGFGEVLAFEARVDRARRRARGSRRISYRREALGRQVRSFRSAAAFNRGAAVREYERRQGSGVLLGRADGGAAQFPIAYQRIAGRGTHVIL